MRPLYFQGAFALCRVIKKNEHAQRTSDVPREPKAKQIRSSVSLSNGEFSSTGMPIERAITSEDTTFRASHLSDGSTFSSPVASTTGVENETFSMGTSPSSLWLSSEFILDSSKVLKLVN